MIPEKTEFDLVTIPIHELWYAVTEDKKVRSFTPGFSLKGDKPRFITIVGMTIEGNQQVVWIGDIEYKPKEEVVAALQRYPEIFGEKPVGEWVDDRDGHQWLKTYPPHPVCVHQINRIPDELLPNEPGYKPFVQPTTTENSAPMDSSVTA